MTLTADLYFSFRSPYSYLAIGRYRALAELTAGPGGFALLVEALRQTPRPVTAAGLRDALKGWFLGLGLAATVGACGERFGDLACRLDRRPVLLR